MSKSKCDHYLVPTHLFSAMLSEMRDYVEAKDTGYYGPGVCSALALAQDMIDQGPEAYVSLALDQAATHMRDLALFMASLCIPDVEDERKWHKVAGLLGAPAHEALSEEESVQ